MILADDDLDVTADKLSAILNAAGISVDAFWPGLWAKSLQGVSKSTISSLFSAPGGGGAAVAVAGKTQNIYLLTLAKVQWSAITRDYICNNT